MICVLNCLALVHYDVRVRKPWGVDPEQHFGGGMPQLVGNPLRGLGGCQPQRGAGMAGLVGTALGQSEMTEQWIPHLVGHVLVIERCTQPVAEHIVRRLPGSLLLLLEGVIDQLRHLDVALTTVILGVFLAALGHSFADQDQTALEIDELPLQAIDFGSAQASEEARGAIGTEVGAYRRQDALHIFQRQGLGIRLLDLELLDGLERRTKS